MPGQEYSLSMGSSLSLASNLEVSNGRNRPLTKWHLVVIKNRNFKKRENPAHPILLIIENILNIGIIVVLNVGAVKNVNNRQFWVVIIFVSYVTLTINREDLVILAERIQSDQSL